MKSLTYVDLSAIFAFIYVPINNKLYWCIYIEKLYDHLFRSEDQNEIFLFLLFVKKGIWIIRKIKICK